MGGIDMTQVSRATHASSVSTKLADNSAGDISEQDVREVITDLEDSVTWYDECDVSADTTPQLGGDLDVNGNDIVSTSNGDINILPNGTGNVVLGNYTLNADATVGSGQDDYVLKYDHSSGTWGPEAESGGGGGGSGYSQEEIEDFAAAMLTGGSHSLISFSYDDANGEIDATVTATLSSFTNDAAFITSGGAPVQSVAGRTGTVSLTTADIASGTFADGRIAESNVTQHAGALSLAASAITSGTFGTSRIADEAITLPKLAHMATDSFLGRTTASSGDVEVLSKSDALTILNVADGAEVNLDQAQQGAGTPSGTSSTPAFVDQLYWDTVNSQLYIATGTSAPTDFKLVPGSGGGGSGGSITATNTTGSAMAKGDVVGGTTAAIILADADSEATLPVLGVVNEAIADTASGEVVTNGLVTGIDTSSFAAGDIVYVSSTAGDLTSTAPTTGFIAQVGVVMVSDASGSIHVDPKIYGAATITEEDWLHAQAWTSASTNGPSATTVDYSTGGQTRSVLAFDTTTEETAFIDVKMPKGWDEGTVTFTPYWSHPSTTTNFGVVWGFSGVTFSDSDSLDTAFAGTEVTSADTGGTTDDMFIGPESSALTVDGTPAEGDMITFEVARKVGNASDNMAVDARLHGVLIKWTRNAVTDA